MTEAATRFVGTATFASLTGQPVHTSLWEHPGEVLHVRLAHETDVAVVAPATANLLAKLTHGLADDLLTSTLLEFAGPLVVAPAMHSGMWSHPATRGNVEVLTGRGARFVGPVDGPLAHGDAGPGRLAEPEDILTAIGGALGGGPLSGRSVVVAAGPTHEPIDAVRFVGNRSSGRMGMAIAAEALARGAAVTMVLGPGTVPPPAGATIETVTTAAEMRDAVLAAAVGADVIVMAAAVSDFRPSQSAAHKLKKHDGPPEMDLEPTPDILAELGQRRREAGSGPVLVGFAAETEDVVDAGAAKLTSKGVDLLVANDVGSPGTGFGSLITRAVILPVENPAEGSPPHLQERTKADLAAALLDRIAGFVETS